ncbi:1-phosphatidylinositol 4,5-bisphosphate phosphodiesterase beta-1-like isoform X3 [Clavelina lepadiformis]|uniref:1-phosphatidylinositol 4,5-bisphosphate phosphodiesterase beta-1-like isoform X3 n=1 Tax=Clavelina lepadiformis TaxID=159417 RepID=UPI004042C79F
MAGAEAAVHKVNIDKPQIPQRLLKGSKFLKWPKSDGDDSVAVPVTLRVDPKGYVLYWHEPNKDTECLEISSIRDTRFGKYAREPKQEKLDRMISGDPQLGKMVSDPTIPLNERCFTIVYGVKLVELNFLNFISVDKNPLEVVKEWADFLLKLAYHPTTRHISVETSIEKAFTKLKLETNQFGEIPVKKLYKMLGGRKRVESVLNSVGLITSKKNSTIDPEEFQLSRFKKLLQLCCLRTEMDSVFAELGFGAKRMYITKQKMKDFVNTVQRDPKLNEILYPFTTDDQAGDYIQEYEPNIMFSQRGQLTPEGFDAYLQSDDNNIVGIEKYAEHQDMTLPLSHYFINSSHNTYLTGTQYRSKSSAEMYRQVLLTGCRCVELDCWDGDDEPIINHGFTLCTPVLFRDVVEAINESAFKTSPYPVILSFENHVDNPQQQAKMAQYCRDIFKEKLLIDPLDEFPIESNKILPPPKDLLYKIIVKNKKQRPKKGASTVTKSSTEETSKATVDTFLESESNRSKSGSIQSETALLSKAQSLHQNSTAGNGKRTNTQLANNKKSTSPVLPSTNGSNGVNLTSDIIGSTDFTDCEKVAEKLENMSLKISTSSPAYLACPNTDTTKEEPTSRKNSTEESSDSTKKTEASLTNGDDKLQNDEDSPDSNDTETLKEAKDEDDDDEDDEDEGSITNLDYKENAEDCGTALKESKAYGAMSSLVNYIQPVRFKSFEISERRSRSYEISSFTETAALRLLTFYPLEFVRYNRRQTSRIYPKGARMDSSNYMPQVFWNAGCQFVALNFQMLDLPMQVNFGLFEFNGGTGYMLKPELMRKKDRMFDPFSQSIDGIVATTLTIRVISGQFLSSSRLSTFVEVEMYGLPKDTYRKQRTKTIEHNSINPCYNSNGFTFTKIILPELAILRIAVLDNGGNMIGQRFLRVEGLRPGYRYITLRNEGNQPLTMPSLFVHLQVDDYVPDIHKSLADALANPITYLRDQEIEEKQRQERRKAMKVLLDEREKEMFDPSHIPAGYGTIPKKHPKPKTKQEQKKSESSLSTARPVHRSSSSVSNSEKIDNNQLVGKFVPQTVNDLKLKTMYEKLENEQKKRVEKFKKRQLQVFTACYNQMFSTPRRSSVLPVLRSPFSRRPSIADVSIDTNPALPDEAKKSELIKLLKDHYLEEKNYRFEKLPQFIQKFAELIKRHQKHELEKLQDIAQKEQDAVQKQKDADKETKIKNIPSNLSKEEVEEKRKDITDRHIQDCVAIRRTLAKKQGERLEKVHTTQVEILESLEEEEKLMKQKIDKEYKEKVANASDEYERLRSEINSRRQGSGSTVSTSSTLQDEPLRRRKQTI